VYAVPDPDGGDAVMAAFEWDGPEPFAPEAFAKFLAAQSDLGPKWVPRFVRVVDAMPLTGSNKIRKVPLRQERWATTDPVWWRPDARSAAWLPMTDADRAAHEATFEARGRAAALR
jgi:fatty-acyl-CoA synthase